MPCSDSVFAVSSFRWNQTCTDEHMHRRVGTPGKIHDTCLHVQSVSVTHMLIGFGSFEATRWRTSFSIYFWCPAAYVAFNKRARKDACGLFVSALNDESAILFASSTVLLRIAQQFSRGLLSQCLQCSSELHKKGHRTTGHRLFRNQFLCFKMALHARY